MFCNTKVAKVLRELFAFTHHEMFLGWHVGNETPFYRHQLGLNQIILISTDKGQDCFLITDRFQFVSWLSMPLCTSHSSCVQYFFPVTFYFITHNLISELICFVFFICMDVLGCYWHLVKNFMSTTPLEIYLLRKMVTGSILILPAVFMQYHIKKACVLTIGMHCR